MLILPPGSDKESQRTRREQETFMSQQVSSKHFKRPGGTGLEGGSVLCLTFLQILRQWKAISTQNWKLLELHNASQRESLICLCQSDASFIITSIKTCRSPLFCCYLIAPELSVSRVIMSQSNRTNKYPFTELFSREEWTHHSSIHFCSFADVPAPCRPQG